MKKNKTTFEQRQERFAAYLRSIEWARHSIRLDVQRLTCAGLVAQKMTPQQCDKEAEVAEGTTTRMAEASGNHSLEEMGRVMFALGIRGKFIAT